MAERQPYSEYLELADDRGQRTDIADFIASEPFIKSGLKQQQFSLTVPLLAHQLITTGMLVKVFDKVDGHLVVAFTVDSVLTKISGEQFLKIDGSNLIKP
jgi:hypothetical protein